MDTNSAAGFDGFQMGVWVELAPGMGESMAEPTQLIFVNQIWCSGWDHVEGKMLKKNNKTRKSLGWSPPVSVDEALQKTAKYFLSNRLDLET